MKKVVLLVVAVCLGVFSFAQDQNASELVTKANDAVTAKDYVKAVELFEKVLAIPDHGQDVETINKVLGQLKPVVAKDEANSALGSKEYKKAVELYHAAAKDYPDAGIAELAGKSFYNEGIVSYKGSDFLTAAMCFRIAEKEFNFEAEKSEKYKKASLKKVAESLAAEGKASVDEISVCEDNKALLIEELANAYVKDGNELYKAGVEIINAANTKVNDGSMSTADETYTAEVAKAKKEFAAALEVLKKAATIDASNVNAQKLIEACKAAM